jgi:hypothetical protein
MELIQIKHSTTRTCFATFLFIIPTFRRTNQNQGFSGGT